VVMDRDAYEETRVVKCVVLHDKESQ